MAFPTTGTLDNFNRADEDPLTGGGNWGSVPVFVGYDLHRIISNQVASGGDTSVSSTTYWASATNANCEVWCDVPVAPANSTDSYVSLMLRLAQPNSSADGYLAEFLYDGTLTIYRIDNETLTALGASVDFGTFGNNDAVGFEASGSTLKAYYKASGGSWVEQLSRTDSTYGAGGFIGLFTRRTAATRVDNFSGGDTLGRPRVSALTFGTPVHSLVNAGLVG